MKPKTIFCSALALIISLGNLSAREPITDRPMQKLVHHWDNIMFLWNTTLPDGTRCSVFLVGSGEFHSQDSQGFRLCVMNIAQGFAFFKTNAVTAHLYRANGEIVAPTKDGMILLNAPVSVRTATSPGDGPPEVITCFPWGTNTLEECWIEVSIASERYWLEIPYGFDRDPREPLPPSRPGGPPQFAPAMKSLTSHDHVLRWQTVHYDLGVIQNGWRLSFIQSNSVDATSEIVLYREDIKKGTATSWKTNSPATALRILDTGGTSIGSHCVDVHIEDGGMERCNTYVIDRTEIDDQRGWGQVEISVDDKSYRAMVPTSLYKSTHGHTPGDP